MRILILNVISFILVFSCGTNKPEGLIKTENYEVNITKNSKSVLILFPCYPCDVEHTKREATFIKQIDEQGVTTILLNFNKKLYITEVEKEKLSKELHSIFKIYKINEKNVFIGGFSSGGNLALLMSDFLNSHSKNIKIKGVFSVDAPVDLEQLYYNAKNDVRLNANEDAKSEGEFLSNLLETEIGNPSTSIDLFRTYSPFLVSQNFIGNLYNHKNYKIRLYIEPSPEWHQKNRKREYQNTNSWMNEKFYEALIRSGNNSCEIIKTENKGIRANGDIHPHSWSIVEQKSLLEWMK